MPSDAINSSSNFNLISESGYQIPGAKSKNRIRLSNLNLGQNSGLDSGFESDFSIELCSVAWLLFLTHEYLKRPELNQIDSAN